MTFVIKLQEIVGYGPGATVKDRFAGKYVKYYDPNGMGGRGELRVTPHKQYALQFDNVAEAWDLWRAQSTLLPTRPDGNPNRPLTAFTIMVERLDEE